MFSGTNPRADDEFRVFRAAKRPGRPRWTLGRVANDLAIVMIAVPMGLKLLEPEVRGPGSCGTTLDNFAVCMGLMFFAIRTVLIASKPLLGIAERGLTVLTGQLDAFALHERPRTRRKPQPLDDFRSP